MMVASSLTTSSVTFLIATKLFFFNSLFNTALAYLIAQLFIYLIELSAVIDRLLAGLFPFYFPCMVPIFAQLGEQIVFFFF